MNDDLRLTDEMLHDMFERRARRGTSDGLRWSILGVTRATVQQRSRVRAPAGGRHPLRLLAVAALLATAVGAGLLIAGGRQELPPARHLAGFAVPFDFRPVEGVPTNAAIFGASVIAFRPAEGVPADAFGAAIVGFTVGGPGAQTLAGGGAPGSNIYPLSDAGQPLPGAHGITISHPVNGALVHDCPGAQGRVPIRLDPDGFVDDLQVLAGVGMRQRETTTFDGRPAITVDIDPSRNRCDYADFHIDAMGLSSGRVVDLKLPSRLIVTDVGGKTVVLQAWAATPEDLAAWLPTASRFLDGIHFTGDATP